MSLAPLVVLSAADLGEMQHRHAIPVDDAVFRFEGERAVECLQGLFSNDVSRIADHGAAWGAFLTPKGMIVSDAWILRDTGAVWVVIPRRAHEPMAALFARTVPPRLARVSDATGGVALRWLVGGASIEIGGATAFRPPVPAPMSVIVLASGDTLDDDLAAAGYPAAPPSWADATRFLLGWPTLGREIDDRTLPQEVRCDELGGVRYDKGCYTGQETVARVHFRGHVNRQLRGLQWPDGGSPESAEVTAGEGQRPVGSISTLVDVAGRPTALAVLRREVGVGDTVIAGGVPATVVALPFVLGGNAVA